MNSWPTYLYMYLHELRISEIDSHNSANCRSVQRQGRLHVMLRWSGPPHHVKQEEESSGEVMSTERQPKVDHRRR